MFEGKCEVCFVKYYEGKVRKLIKKFDLIEKGDKVMAAVSGGKDSLSCLFLLGLMRGSLKMELEAMYIDLGMKGCTGEKSKKVVEELCRRIDVKLNVVKISDYADRSIIEAAKITGRPMCSVCGVAKRYLMNKFTREKGFEKLATGHNTDDVIRFFFKNVVSGRTEWTEKLKPLLKPLHEKMVYKIKPLFECEERENEFYLSVNGIDFVKNRCSFRDEWKEIADKIESTKKGFKLSLVRWLEKVKIEETPRALKECEICGEPTSSSICSFCRIFKSV